MGWINTVISAVTNAVSKAWDAVKSVASSVVNYVSGIVSNVSGSVSDIVKNVSGYVSSTVKSVSDTVSKTISSISASMGEYFSPTTEKYYNLITQEKEAKDAKRYDEVTTPFKTAWENFKEKINAGLPLAAAGAFITLLTTPILSNINAGTVPITGVGGLEQIISPSGKMVLSDYIKPTVAVAKATGIAKLFALGKTALINLGKAALKNPIIVIFAATEIPQQIVMWGFLKKWWAEQTGTTLTSTSIAMGKLEEQFNSLGYSFRDALKANDKETASAIYKTMENLILKYNDLVIDKRSVLEKAGEWDMANALVESFGVILQKMEMEVITIGKTVKEAYPEFFTPEKEKYAPQPTVTSAKDLTYSLDQLHDFFGDLEWGIKAALEEKNYEAAKRVIENMNTIKGAYDKILNDFKSVLQTAGIYEAKKATSDVMGGVIKRYEEKIPVLPVDLEESVEMTIREIVDGDTVRSHFKGFTYEIRLVGVNAPELAHTVEGAYRSAEIGSRESKDWLSSMIWGLDVIVKIDPEHVLDKYGRILGTIYLGDTNINLSSLKEGWTMYYPYDMNKYIDGLVYEAAEKEAKEKKKGVWGLARGVGTINITSSPNYAEIFIDDVDTMLLTSETFTSIPVGKHTIYVIKYEWISDTVEIDVEAGKEYDVRFEK